MATTSEPFVDHGAPFMHCTKCGIYSSVWNTVNEAYVCACGMDESGLELVDPWSLIGKFFNSGRNGRVRITEYLGGNTFRTINSRDNYFVTSILTLRAA